jgi:hypothetical protein
MFDMNTIFADQFDLTTLVAGTPNTLTSSLPLGLPGTPPNAFQGPIGGPVIHDIGRGRRIPIFAQITATVLTTASITCDLITADDFTMTTNKTVILSTGAVAVAKLVTGYRFRLGVVPKGISQAFLGMQLTATTAAPTAGKFTGALRLDDNDHADILG